MLSPLDRIIRKTPFDRRKKAQSEVRIGTIKKKFDRIRNIRKLIISVSSHAKNRATHNHIVTIEYDGDRVSRSKNIIVDCSCDDFKFTWEVALEKAGLARIFRSNGDRPVEKNPFMIPGGCKHIFRALVLIKRRGL